MNEKYGQPFQTYKNGLERALYLLRQQIRQYDPASAQYASIWVAELELRAEIQACWHDKIAPVM